MENWLKALIAAACLVIIGGGAYFGFMAYTASSRVIEANQTATDAARVNSLRKDMCGGAVSLVVAQHSQYAITSANQVGAGLAHDIGLCIRHGLLGDFTKNELERTNLYQLFSGS